VVAVSFAEPENDYLPVTFQDEAGWAFIAYLVEEGTDNAATVLDELNLRTEPNTDAEVLLVMPAGATLRVFGSAEDDAGEIWNRVVYDNTVGWAFAAFIGEPDGGETDGDDGGDEPGTPNQAAMTTDDLNLRAEPSLEAEVLTVIPAGAEILVGSDVVDGFVQTTYGEETGWASAEFISAADEGDAGDDGGAAEGEERIALDDLNLRAGPSTSDTILLVIPAGGSMTLTGEGAENGFVTVTYQGTDGWVAAEFIARPDELAGEGDEGDEGGAEEPSDDETADGGDYAASLAGQSRVTLADLNLREGPSTESAVLLVIPAGETVTMTGEGVENDFVTVEFDGTTGWVAAEFLGE
jgi:uncharacterized protein YraI